VKRPDIVPIFLRLAPRDIALAKFIFESYEGVAIVRTLDRRRAIIVVLVVADQLEVAQQILAALCQEIECEPVPPPAAGDDWLLGAVEEDTAAGE